MFVVIVIKIEYAAILKGTGTSAVVFFKLDFPVNMCAVVVLFSIS